MSKLNVGIIGLGKMGLLHTAIFNSLENSTVTAIAEKNKYISSIFKKYMPDFNFYTDYEKMFDKENLDIAVITTPVFLHKSMIEHSIDHKLNIFVEKPLALNSEECLSILLKKNKNTTSVGYNRRFVETYILLKKIIDESLLGKVNFFQSESYIEQVFSQEKSWLYDPEKSGGGVLVDLGSHTIDLFHFLFGDIELIQALGKSIYSEKVEDFVSANIKFKNNILGSLQLSWSMRKYRLPELKMKIQFDNGMVTVTEKYIEIYSELDIDMIKKGWNTFYKQDLVSGLPVNIAGPEFTIEDLHLLNCINEGKESLCNFKESAKTNFVIDSIYSSIKNNEVEKIRYGV